MGLVERKWVQAMLLGIAIISWAVSFPLLKIALDTIPPATLAFLRFAVGAVPVLAYLHAREGLGNSLRGFRGHWKLLLVSAIGGVVLSNLFQNYGMRWTTATASAILQSSGPVLTIVLAFFFLGEKLGARKTAGATIAVVGTILLVTEGGTVFGGGSFVGNVLMVGAGAAYSIGGVAGKRLLKHHSPYAVSGIGIIIGLVVLGMCSLGELAYYGFPAMTAELWFIVILVGLFPAGLSYMFWYMVLEHRELSRQVLTVYLVPVLAVVFSIALLGEALTAFTVVFGGLIISGVALAQYEKTDRSHGS